MWFLRVASLFCFFPHSTLFFCQNLSRCVDIFAFAKLTRVDCKSDFGLPPFFSPNKGLFPPSLIRLDPLFLLVLDSSSTHFVSRKFAHKPSQQPSLD